MSGQGIGRPTAGVRYVLERAEEQRVEVVYRGFAHLPDADVPVTARVELPAGGVSVTLGDPDRNGASKLVREVTALVRSATKSAVLAGRSLPRKIARWRGD